MALLQEKHVGALWEGWSSLLSNSGLETTDIAAGIADVLAVKDPAEILNVKKAALMCASVMKNFAVAEIESIIDDEKKVKHSKLAERTEAVIQEPAKVKHS